MGLSVDGLVSGLDTTSIVSQLIALERRPITLLENRQAGLVSQKEAWQDANTKLLALETASKKLNTAAKFNSFTAEFQNNSATGGSVLSVTAGSNATSGTYDIIVSQLSKAEKWASTDSISDNTAAIGTSGTITIGSTNVSVVSTDSLNDIKNSVNASAASVTATVFNAGTSASPDYKLVITGDSTGADNAFSVTEDISLTFSNTQNAQNSLLTVDGVSIQKDTNSINDVIGDTTINLETIGSGTITFSTDYTAIIDKVKEFASAYNEVTNYIAEQFTYNQELDQKGVLFGNASLQVIQSQLRSIVNSSVPGIDATDSSNLAYLSQVGVRTDDTNQLVVDESELSDALKDNFSKVRDLFVPGGSGTYTLVAASGNTEGGTYNTRVSGGVLQLQLQGGDGSWISTTQSSGYAYGQTGTILDGLLLQTGTLTEGETGSVRISIGIGENVATKTASYTEFSTDGMIFNQNKSIEDRDKEIQSQIDDLETRLAIKEESIKAKFVNLEVLMSKLTSEQGYLDQQLSNLSKGWK